MTVRFSNQLGAELFSRSGLRQAGGVRPRRGRNLQGRYLSFSEREEIALAHAAGESMRSIAARLIWSFPAV